MASISGQPNPAVDGIGPWSNPENFAISPLPAQSQPIPASDNPITNGPDVHWVPGTDPNAQQATPVGSSVQLSGTTLLIGLGILGAVLYVITKVK